MSTTGMWKPPPRRDYNPKPMDPGQVIVWTYRIEGHWTVRPSRDADTGAFTEGEGWIPSVKTERIGIIWSEGSSPSTWWVLPDDDMLNPVLVRRAGKRADYGFKEGDLFQSREGEGWREAIRRAENVRKRGIYAVVQETYTVPLSYGSRETHQPLMWHADPGCPDAAGKERDDGKDGHEGYRIDRYAPTDAGGGIWDVNSVTDVLTGRVHLSSPPPFCSRCVMLEPESARELVTA